MTDLRSQLYPASGSASLAVVAISYNEAANMRPFLDHLVEWVDEIVIVDDGSGDGTADIVGEYGEKVRFIESPRGHDEFFSHQRNKGIDAANADWLLHMDIDERVTPELAREILAVIHRGEYRAFRFKRLNHFLNRPMAGGGWQGWNQVHLARRETLRFGGMFHEDCLLNPGDTAIGQLREKMLHLNETSFADRLRKSDTYLLEMTRDLRESGKSVSALQLIGIPVAEFLRKYLFKRGFVDGVPGLISALHSASARFRALALVWDEQNALDRADLEAGVRERWTKTRNGTGVASRGKP